MGHAALSTATVQGSEFTDLADEGPERIVRAHGDIDAILQE